MDVPLRTIVAIPGTIRWLTTTDWASVSSMEWGGICYVVVCATYLAYICIMIGQKTLRPTVVGMYNYVQPIVATITGIALGLDVFTPIKALAILLIFSGVWLVTVSRAKSSDNAVTKK